MSKRKLTKSDRSKLARVVIPHLVNETPGGILTPVQINKWAEYAVEIFPEDDISFYFYTVAPTDSEDCINKSYGSRQLPSKSRRYYGCFWDRWNNYRKVLRENKSITCNRRKSSASSKDAAASVNAEEIGMFVIYFILIFFKGINFLKHYWYYSGYYYIR